MRLLYIGQMDDSTPVSRPSCTVHYKANERLSSIKRRVIDALARGHQEFASVLLDKIEGDGPFNTGDGWFVLSWEEE